MPVEESPRRAAFYPPPGRLCSIRAIASLNTYHRPQGQQSSQSSQSRETFAPAPPCKARRIELGREPSPRHEFDEIRGPSVHLKIELYAPVLPCREHRGSVSGGGRTRTLLPETDKIGYDRVCKKMHTVLDTLGRWRQSAALEKH